MLHIAVIEDSAEEMKVLQDCLNRYSEEQGETFKITTFTEATSFLEGYRAQYDMVFMDIELPWMNGLEAARRLRELDQQIVLIFVTNMAQFAVKGYEVDALDYIVKPVKYGPFSIKLGRAVKRCGIQAETVVINSAGGSVRMLLRDVLYIEAQGHRLTWHTEQGDYPASGTLRDTEEQLRDKGFLRCDKGYIVNQRQIAQVVGYDLVLMNGDRLPISRLRKKTFMADLTTCMQDEAMQ